MQDLLLELKFLLQDLNAYGDGSLLEAGSWGLLCIFSWNILNALHSVRQTASPITFRWLMRQVVEQHLSASY